MASAGRTRPTLLGTASAPAPERDFELSILDALNETEGASPRSAPRARRRGARAWLAVLGIAAAAAGSALLWVPPEATPAPHGDATPVATLTSPGVAAVTAAAEAASAAQSSGQTAQPARIEELATAPAMPAAAGASSPTAPMASPFAQLAEAPAPEDSATVQARPAKKEGAAATASTADAKAATAKTSTPPRAGGSPSRTAAQASASKAAASSDADVEIVAALIGHMNESSAADSAGEGSIAELVRHCRSLPGSEAQACQRRICQGYWGRAEACPRDRQAAVRVAG